MDQLDKPEYMNVPPLHIPTGMIYKRHIKVGDQIQNESMRFSHRAWRHKKQRFYEKYREAEERLHTDDIIKTAWEACTDLPGADNINCATDKHVQDMVSVLSKRTLHSTSNNVLGSKKRMQLRQKSLSGTQIDQENVKF